MCLLFMTCIMLVCAGCVKGSQLGEFFPYRPQCTVTLNSNFCYLKNLTSFSIPVKELSEPIDLQKRRQGFALFKSIFLRYQSLSNTR